MEWIEVRKNDGSIVWKSPEVEVMGLDLVGNTVKLLDLEASQMMGGHVVQSDELVFKMPANTPVNISSRT